LFNLLDNSVKYSRRKGKIYITSQYDGTKEKLTVRITDSNEGLGKNLIEHLTYRKREKEDSQSMKPQNLNTPY